MDARRSLDQIITIIVCPILIPATCFWLWTTSVIKVVLLLINSIIYHTYYRFNHLNLPTPLANLKTTTLNPTSSTITFSAFSPAHILVTSIHPDLSGIVYMFQTGNFSCNILQNTWKKSKYLIKVHVFLWFVASNILFRPVRYRGSLPRNHLTEVNLISLHCITVMYYIG